MKKSPTLKPPFSPLPPVQTPVRLALRGSMFQGPVRLGLGCSMFLLLSTGERFTRSSLGSTTSLSSLSVVADTNGLRRRGGRMKSSHTSPKFSGSLGPLRPLSASPFFSGGQHHDLRRALGPLIEGPAQRCPGRSRRRCHFRRQTQSNHPPHQTALIPCVSPPSSDSTAAPDSPG